MRQEIIKCDTCGTIHDAQYVLPPEWIYDQADHPLRTGRGTPLLLTGLSGDVGNTRGERAIVSTNEPDALQLTRQEIEHIQLLQAEALRHDTVRMSLWQRDLQRHERLIEFLDAHPDTQTFTLKAEQEQPE